MKIVSPDVFLAGITKKTDFPFFYDSAYNTFLKTQDGKETKICMNAEGSSMVFKKWNTKFLSIAQAAYPPLDKQATRLSATKEKEFLTEMIAHFKKGKTVHRITQPENFAIFQNVPDGATAAPFGTYFIDLSKHTKEELFKNLHSKHRNVIRSAEKNGVELRYGSSVLKDFYALYQKTMERSSMYTQSFDHFKAMNNALPDNILCGVAYHNNIPQGGLFIPYTGFGAFYLYGASAQKTSVNGAINLLHWESLNLLKEKGVRRYDFVGARLSDISGTKLEGIQQFKERFGAELEKGFLWKMDLNKKRCSLFDNLVALKLKLKKIDVPLDIIDQERKKIHAS